jgi:hypothetical protein
MLHTDLRIDSIMCEPKLWKVVVNLELDTVYLDWQNLDSNYEDDIYDSNLPVQFLQATFMDSANKIKHLAISACYLYDDYLGNRVDGVNLIKTFLERFKNIQHLTFVVVDYTKDLPAHQRDELVFINELIDIKRALKLYSKHPRDVKREVIRPHLKLKRMKRFFTAEDVHKAPDSPGSFGEPKWHDIHPDLVIDYAIALPKWQAELLASKKKRYFELKKELVSN